MRSIAEAAITLPAQSMPLYAMLLLPQATVCHVCRGMPLGHVAVSIYAAGVSQLTSPTSVLPAVKPVPE